MLLSPRCFFVFARYLSAYRQRVSLGAGWSSPVARQAHNLKVVSSNLAPATNPIPKTPALAAGVFLCALIGLSTSARGSAAAERPRIRERTPVPAVRRRGLPGEILHVLSQPLRPRAHRGYRRPRLYYVDRHAQIHGQAHAFENERIRSDRHCGARFNPVGRHPQQSGVACGMRARFGAAVRASICRDFHFGALADVRQIGEIGAGAALFRRQLPSGGLTARARHRKGSACGDAQPGRRRSRPRESGRARNRRQSQHR